MMRGTLYVDEKPSYQVVTVYKYSSDFKQRSAFDNFIGFTSTPDESWKPTILDGVTVEAQLNNFAVKTYSEIPIMNLCSSSVRDLKTKQIENLKNMNLKKSI